VALVLETHEAGLLEEFVELLYRRVTVSDETNVHTVNDATSIEEIT
jgi:hypothetical protein